ncbi:MAG: hypothetical protein DRN71_01520 [Candidatus Nanohalarchaeota archaeon]|nr:MAG: hypothetical protein DRN71_01520 [Candidatus Nanohaloarchaeota archaeon]
MKTELSSLEIRVLTDELKCLIGARIQKVYQEKKTMHLSMYVPRQGTKTLIIGDGKIFLTKYRLKHSEIPTAFAMYLRKYCKGQKITNIFQHEFERIVILEMGEYNLIIELFSKGNVIFADKDNNIWSVLERQSWSSRKIKQREEYKFPPAGINPMSLTCAVLEKSLAASEKQLVAYLARELSLGGTFAEEVCCLAKIDKKTQCSTIKKVGVKSIHSSINTLFKMPKKAQIIYENSAEIDTLPYDTNKYKSYKKKHYDNFYDAVDDFFVKKIAETEENTEQKKVTKKKDKLIKRYDNQKSAIESLKKQESECTKSAEFIYEYYPSFEKLMGAVEKHGLSGIKKVIKEITSVDMKTKIITLNVKGTEIKINTTQTLAENADNYYKKAKKTKQKQASASEALKETGEKMKEAKEVPIKKIVIEKKTEPSKWYHKFRWFISVQGFLVVAGKDATSNEVLIKKHTDADDVVFHADITGSPFVVVKTEKEMLDKSTLNEAAQFTGIYSRAWKAKVGTAEVYYVAPEQVSKKAPSGEYITKGAFMIYGKKNIMKTELRLGIGFKDKEIITGPEKSIMLCTKKYILVEPGDERSSVLAKKIKAALFARCNKEEQEFLRKISPDEIAKAIPFGSGKMI